MAVAISDWDSPAGMTINPAMKYAKAADGPASFVARPGNTNIPLPIMAPRLTVNTAPSPRLRCSPAKVRGLPGWVSKILGHQADWRGRSALLDPLGSPGRRAGNDHGSAVVDQRALRQLGVFSKECSDRSRRLIVARIQIERLEPGILSGRDSPDHRRAARRDR